MTDTDRDSDRLDRDLLLEIAAERMGEPKHGHTPHEEIPFTELVRTMRETEKVVKSLRDEPDNAVTPDFAFGFWTAMAAIRHDFAIEDELWVDVEDDGG